MADEEHKQTGERLQSAVERLERAVQTRLAALQASQESTGKAHTLFEADAGQSVMATDVEALSARNAVLEARVAALESALSAAIVEVDRILSGAPHGKDA